MHRSSASQDSHGSQRGVTLLTVLMIVTVMLILVGSLLESMPAELRNVAYTGYDNRALYVADSGIQLYLTKTEELAVQQRYPASSYSYTFNEAAPASTFTVTQKGADTFAGLRYYWIESVGKSPQGDTRVIDAVIGQTSFAHENYWGKMNASGNYFVSGLMQFNGPVYLEGSSSLPVNVAWADSDPSIFLSKEVQFGQKDGQSSDVLWYNTSGSQQNPSSSQDWQSVDAFGQSGITQTTNLQNFPPDVANTLVADEAFSGTQTSGPGSLASDVFIDQKLASTNGQSGCTVGAPCSGGPISSGIYVNGNANLQMTASAVGATPSTQTFVFSPPTSESGIPNTVTIAINFTANKTTVTENGQSTVYTGVPSGPGGTDGTGPNGAIFVNGNVDSLKGSVNGQFTVAAPDTSANGRNITITGDILYQQDPIAASCSSQPCASQDILGIYSHNITLADHATTHDQWGDLTIEAAMFGGNSGDVGNAGQGTFATQSGTNVCSDSNLPKQNDLLIYGSMVQNFISPLGCFGFGQETDPATGKTRYKLQRGWGDSYTWDSRFNTQSPPFYPKLTKFQIFAWKDKGVK